MDGRQRTVMQMAILKVKIRRMTIHMAIAAYSHSEPDKQVVRMAYRYKKKCISPATKRTLRKIIRSARPAYLVTTVYDNVSD